MLGLQSGSLGEVTQQPLAGWGWIAVLVVAGLGLGLLSWCLLWARRAERKPQNIRLAFDPEEALELCGGDQALLAEIAGELPAECWSQVEAIRDGLRSGSVSAVRAAAHRLKGTLLAVAATPSAELAATLERRAIAEDLDEMPLILRTLEGELHRLDRALTAEGVVGR